MTETPLSTILRPLPVADFLANHWDRAAVHVHGEPLRYAEIYDVADWHARRHLGAIDAARVEHGRQRQGAIAWPGIAAALEAGATVCADVSSSPVLAPMLEALRELVPGPEAAFAKVYASPSGAGFALHMDAHHVFVLQLEGRKRWRYSQTPAVTAPLWGGKIDDGRAVHTFPRDGDPIADDAGRWLAAPAMDELVTTLLVPGDLLYLPPGSWHTTEATESSIAISLSPPRAPVLAFVLRALEQQLALVPELRRDLARLHHGAGQVPETIRRALDAGLAAVARATTGLDRRALHRAWASQAHAAPTEPRTPSSSAVTLRRHDVLIHADPRGFTWLVAPTSAGEQLFLYGAGAEWTLPVDARGFVDALARHPELVAESALAWDRRLDWDGAREVLGQLVDAGVLRRREGAGT